jgi:hypothetical protein
MASVLVAALAACGAGSSPNGGGEEIPTPACISPTAVGCVDQAILALELQATSAISGLVVNAPDGAGWTTMVDATAGGFAASPPDAYAYAKFTAAGLVQVDLSDEGALTSMDWDVAFRRQVIRVNSLDSGPSCVTVATLAPGTAYEDVAAVPVGATWQGDDTFDGSCAMNPDPSGLPMPATALGGYFSYAGCLQMTHAVYVLSLADGRFVKLTVDDYYHPDVQAECDASGTLLPSPGAANFVVRWAYLP